jgi:hypothetical protein
MHDAQRDVEGMLERNVPFEHIEAYIEGRKDLDDDRRSALWLLAWVETSRDERRQVVRSIFRDLSDGVLARLT